MGSRQRFGEFDDGTVEELVAGRYSDHPHLGDLAALVAELRVVESAVQPRVVHPELAAVLAAGVRPGDVPDEAAADIVNEQQSRRRSMLTALSTFLATLTGKVVLGTAVAAAGVGAAHAVGVVEVPGLPEKAAVVEAPPVDVPAVEHAGDTGPDAGADVETGEPGSPGVDGGDISDRATSGEPQEDGKAFGTSVAEEATEGTPAEGVAGGGAAGTGTSAGSPATGSDVATEHAPGTTPPGGSSSAGNQAPEGTAPGGPETAEETAPVEPPTGRP